MKLLVVEKLEKDVLDWLASRCAVRFAPELACDPRGLRLALHDVHAVVLPAGVPVDGPLLLRAPVLKAVARLNEPPGPDELAICGQANVQWVGSSLSASRAQAEFMLGALLTLLRRMPVINVGGAWLGRELGASRVGLLGLSRASKPLAEWLACMGTKVLGHDPALPSDDPVWSRWGIAAVGAQELLQQSDAVCIQLQDQHQGFISEQLLRSCKRHQVWVSTAGNGVMDEAAVARSLGGGVLAAAWFDGFGGVGAGTGAGPLAALPQVQFTAQLSGDTCEARLRAGWEVARRLDHLLLQGPGVQAPGAASVLAAQALQLVN